MGHPGYAAFDPIFWLHHCNVDRIFALWQVLNPNSYVTDQTAQFSTFWSNGSQQSNNPTVEGVNTGTIFTFLELSNLIIFSL
jgi:tyrosinase